MKFNVKVSGIDKVLRKLDRHMGDEAVSDVDKITEAYARKMANESSEMAPVKDGLLKNSIASSPQPSDELHVWEYGSNLPYATKQEYTHPTQKAFIRKPVWNNREKYRDAVLKRITKG